MHGKNIFIGLLQLFSFQAHAANTEIVRINLKNASFESQGASVEDGSWIAEINDWYGGDGVVNPAENIIEPQAAMPIGPTPDSC